MTRLAWLILFVAIITGGLLVAAIHMNGVLVGQKMSCEQNLYMSRAEYQTLYNKWRNGR